jgi:hypothetical protein
MHPECHGRIAGGWLRNEEEALMFPEMGRALAEMRIEDLQRQAYCLVRRTARDSKEKRPGRKARRRAAFASGRNRSCV